MNKNLDRSMTVGQLREILEDYSDDEPVMFGCNYGDYHRTQQVLLIEGNLERLPVEDSAYSESGWAVVRDVTDDTSKECRRILVLS